MPENTEPASSDAPSSGDDMATYNSSALSEQIESRRDVMVTDEGGGMRPRNLGEAMELSRILAASDFIPKDYLNKPGNVLVAIQMGSELGLAPMQAIQNIAVINGRPSLWGDAMLAVVMAHPAYDGIDEMDTADIHETGAAKCTIRRKGRTPHTVTFSVEDAKRAKLWGKGGPWTNYPDRMLMMRARAFACRNLFPDALRGIQSAEEARDIPSIEAVATVKASEPLNIVDRVKARKADAKAVVAEADAVDAATGEVTAGRPGTTPADPVEDNGEMSAEEEQRMMDAEAEAAASAEKAR